MVYSIMYYASEAVTRFIVSLILKIYEVMEQRRLVEEREEPRREELPRHGFFHTVNMAQYGELVYVGKASRIRVHIPLLGIKPVARAVNAPPPPERLYFTYAEAASKDWFKEIEWLAEQLEKRRREQEEGEEE